MSNDRKKHGKDKPQALMPAAPSLAELPLDYAAVLQGLKTHIQNSRQQRYRLMPL